ncbi:MAG: hypothetical protein H6822_35300 [Planctomycetaceae bacterium]|nr:hypothetical protein [Planctomycetales bacterium]MCB9927454.1 hypothetical protein [Planctomycetaceae bacterium]
MLNIKSTRPSKSANLSEQSNNDRSANIFLVLSAHSSEQSSIIERATQEQCPSNPA